MIAHSSTHSIGSGMSSADKKHQQGAATIFVAMILLVAITLLTLYTASSSITETKISVNELRSKQALAAAQAGVDLAIANLNNGGDFTYKATQAGLNATASLSFTSPTQTLAITAPYVHSSFCNATTAAASLPTCPDAQAAITCTAPSAGQTLAWLVSCGWSNDQAARRRIITLAGKPPAVPGTVTNPLTSGSTVALTGNPTVVNYYNNLTIWSGNSVNSTGNNGKTVIKKPSSTATLTADQVVTQVGNGNTVCNTATDLICTTSSTVVGPDVIQSDTTLANLSDTQFFQNFLGYTPNEYKVGVASDIVAAANIGTVTAGDKNYWIEGNTTIGNQTIGSNGHPVVLVINGNLTLSGNPVIYGLVYVTGTLTQSGTGTIRGGVVVKNSASGNGSLNIIYDPSNLPGSTGPSDYASLPGSWRDY